MEIRLSFRFLAALLGVSAGVFGCAEHHDSLAMNLEWAPKSDPCDVSSTALSAFVGQTLQIMAFSDHRNTTEVGSNVEERTARPVTAMNNVPAFVTGHVADVFQECHVVLAPSGYTRILKGEVTQFYVKEDNDYNGTLILTLSLSDADGKQLWQGVAAGHSKRWGHSLSAENYNETFSESIIEAVKDLMGNSSFLDAVRGRT